MFDVFLFCLDRQRWRLEIKYFFVLLYPVMFCIVLYCYFDLLKPTTSPTIVRLHSSWLNNLLFYSVLWCIVMFYTVLYYWPLSQLLHKRTSICITVALKPCSFLSYSFMFFHLIRWIVLSYAYFFMRFFELYC